MAKKLWQDNGEIEVGKAVLALSMGGNNMVKICQARFSDFDELYRLWREAGLKLATPSQEKIEFASLIKLNPDSCLVALTEGRIVGSVLAAFNGRRAWIYHLAVSPKWQKQGLGSQLIRKAEQALKKRGATKIILSIHVANLKTVPFYEKNGYGVKNSCLLMAKKL